MSNINYVGVSSDKTTFREPRQRVWAVFQYTGPWTLQLTTTSFTEAQAKAKALLNGGGSSVSIDKIMVCEIVPIDTVLTPTI